MVDRRVAALQASTLIHLAVAGALAAGLIQLMAAPSGPADETLLAFSALGPSAAFGLVSIGLLLGMRLRAANIVAEIDDPDLVSSGEHSAEVSVRTRRRLDWTLAMIANAVQIGSLGLALWWFRSAVVA